MGKLKLPFQIIVTLLLVTLGVAIGLKIPESLTSTYSLFFVNAPIVNDVDNFFALHASLLNNITSGLCGLTGAIVGLHCALQLFQSGDKAV